MTDTPSSTLEKQALKALLDPPYVELAPPAVYLHMAAEDHPLHQRMEHNKEPDSYERYRLALRAEPLRQESRMHRFLCASTRQLPEGAGYLLSATRKAIRHCHGRALLAHEPGLGATIGLAMLVQEYLLRGLVHRALVLAPPDQLGYWTARLNAGLDEPFVACSTLPAEDQPLPNRLLLNADLFKDELPSYMAIEGHYQMIAVTEASGLRRRRSRPWRNLLTLSPAHMLLLSFLPFEEKPVELHGYLALLGVPELPPAARLKRELGPPDGPITPETRQMLRPFLDAAVLRNTHPTTPLAWAPRQWKIQDVPTHAPTQRLRGQVEAWLKRNQPEAGEEDATPARKHEDLLLATQASTAAIGEVLAQMAEDDALADDREQFAGWIADAAKIAHQDPRIPVLRSLLRDSPNSRVLIFCQHNATAQHIAELLQEFEPRTIGSSLAASIPDEVLDPSAPVILLATDSSISPVFTGPIDIIVQFDMPWDATKLDARGHWLLHQQGEHSRQIICLAREESHDAQLLEVLQFRLKLDQMAPEEMPLIEGYMESGTGLKGALWELLSQSTNLVLEQGLSKQLLHARKQYKRLLDLNQRLFLDDYAL